MDTVFLQQQITATEQMKKEIKKQKNKKSCIKGLKCMWNEKCVILI